MCCAVFTCPYVYVRVFVFACVHVDASVCEYMCTALSGGTHDNKYTGDSVLKVG